MAISGKLNINVGLPNESTGSDSLYTAFNKINDNFSNLFNNSSPYNTFTAGVGSNVTANAILGSVTISSYSGSEDLLDGAAANLLVSASYFSTVASETATLAAGTNGQIKTFMMVDDGGDMVITVSNAGWKSTGTGTMTFDDIGDSCMLQYVNNKWFCVGNNGVTFA